MTEPTVPWSGYRRQPKLRGVCVVCKRELYRRPGRHYASKSHAEAVERWERRNKRLSGRA